MWAVSYKGILRAGSQTGNPEEIQTISKKPLLPLGLGGSRSNGNTLVVETAQRRLEPWQGMLGGNWTRADSRRWSEMATAVEILLRLWYTLVSPFCLPSNSQPELPVGQAQLKARWQGSLGNSLLLGSWNFLLALVCYTAKTRVSTVSEPLII